MIDHVTTRLPDLAVAQAFYTLALELLDGPPATEGDGFVEWNDFSIAEATTDRPATRHLHIGLQASDRSQVDRWWRGMRDAGYADLWRPRPTPRIWPTYYGAFVADPAGDSIEAVYQQPRSTDGRTLDHLWLRTRNLEAATLFYEAIAPTVHHHVTRRPGLSSCWVRRGLTATSLPMP